MANAFEVATALSAIVAGVAGIAAPREVVATSSLGELLGIVALVYSCGYVAGGVLTVAGLVRLSVRLEVAGLVLLGGCIVAQAGALAFVRGMQGLPTGVFYLAWAVAAYARAWLVLRISRSGSL